MNENFPHDSFFNHVDRLANWIRWRRKHESGDTKWYCPLDIQEIWVSYKPGPGRNGDKFGRDRCFDHIVVSSLIYDHVEEVTELFSRYEAMSQRSSMHSNDRAFCYEATDWFKVGPLHDNEISYSLYCECYAPTHNDRELQEYMSGLEKEAKEKYPDIGFRFYKPDAPSGCYVATAVYGSYDCPEVWTLRRFRDQRLAETGFGRAFIRCYYALSPTVVKYFGKTAAFNRFFRKRLDRLVARLRSEGFESTPYQDE